MRGLEGKGVLVTGGSRGIGEATARRFLEEGARVHLCGLEPDEVEATVAALAPYGQVSGGVADVSAAGDVTTLVEAATAALGRIDILLNNAGTSHREPFLEIPVERWDRIIAVNLRGMFLVAQAVARRMAADGRGGVIVNMASTNALGGESGYAHYNASKGGVLLLTKTMAVELAPLGIRVNALCPGYILTPLNTSIAAQLGGDGDFAAGYARDFIPAGRAGQAEEVAAAYAFLASDDASFVHGEGLVVDGGQVAVM
jgi:NAD(P)-dependent dehydrogenase (short-subunit alcohol dehydrogenase family)